MLKDQIITCIRRNERHYMSSGNNASKISLTIAYHTCRMFILNTFDDIHVHSCCTLGLHVFM